MTTFDSFTQIAKAHARAKETAEIILELQAELEDNKAILRNAGKGTHKTPVGEFSISENNTYDSEVILSKLSPGQFMRVSVRKLSNPMVKVVYPEIYNSAKVVHAFKVSL